MWCIHARDGYARTLPGNRRLVDILHLGVCHWLADPVQIGLNWVRLHHFDLLLLVCKLEVGELHWKIVGNNFVFLKNK